jgi:hypothetical protein
MPVQVLQGAGRSEDRALAREGDEMSRKSLDIAEMKMELWHDQGGACWTCREPIGVMDGELAHRIPQRKWCLKRYGAAVVHHKLNMRLTHSGRCNDAVSMAGRPMEMLAMEIEDAVRKGVRV